MRSYLSLLVWMKMHEWRLLLDHAWDTGQSCSFCLGLHRLWHAGCLWLAGGHAVSEVVWMVSASMDGILASACLHPACKALTRHKQRLASTRALDH